MKCLPHLASACVVGGYLLVCYTITKACANDVAADFGNALSPQSPISPHTEYGCRPTDCATGVAPGFGDALGPPCWNSVTRTCELKRMAFHLSTLGSDLQNCHFRKLDTRVWNKFQSCMHNHEEECRHFYWAMQASIEDTVGNILIIANNDWRNGSSLIEQYAHCMCAWKGPVPLPQGNCTSFVEARLHALYELVTKRPGALLRDALAARQGKVSHTGRLIITLHSANQVRFLIKQVSRRLDRAIETEG